MKFQKFKVTRELSSSPEQSTINSKTGTPKENSKPLSLIWNNRTSLLPNSSTIKNNISTTNSSVLGTVANSGKDVSALSSLYTLNKTSADKSVVHAPSIRADSRKGVKENVSRDRKEFNEITRTKLRPRLQKTEEFYKSDDSVSNTSKLRDILDSKSRNKQSSTKVEEEFETLTNLLWTEIRNPSKELHSDMLSFLRLSRWNDIFPSNIKEKT